MLIIKFVGEWLHYGKKLVVGDIWFKNNCWIYAEKNLVNWGLTRFMYSIYCLILNINFVVLLYEFKKYRFLPTFFIIANIFDCYSNSFLVIKLIIIF